MNEVKHIHLGHQQFTISVEAYGTLRTYIDAIADKVNGEADVLDEVELRMAEILIERGCSDKKVVLPKDVAALKQQLGAPSDFSESETAESDRDTENTTSNRPVKRLFRNADTAMIAGVASGLGAYLGIDAVIIRLAFIILTFAGGSGVLLYVILWLLVPEAKTTSERLSMQGKAATVENLKQIVERADLPAAAHRTSSMLSKVFSAVGKIVLIIIGLPLTVGASLAILFTIFATTYLLSNGLKAADRVVFPHGSYQVTGLIMSSVATITLLLAMTLIGIAMVRRRWQLPAWGVAALVGIFFISASVGGAAAAKTVPQVRHNISAMHHTLSVQLPSFNTADLRGKNAQYSFVPDTKTYVEYQYFGSVDTTKIAPSVSSGKLVIDTHDLSNNFGCSWFCFGSHPYVGLVVIHAPSLDQVSISGNGADLIPVADVTLKQASMDLTVAPNARANISGVKIVTANIEANVGKAKHAVLSFDPSAMIDYRHYSGLSLSDSISTGSIDSLNIQTNQTCDLRTDGSFIFVDSKTTAFTINNQQVPNAAADIQKLQSDTTPNVYNCLYLNTSDNS